MISLSLILATIENEDDREKLAAFYRKYLNYSLNLAFFILKDPSSAEDAVQDSFKYIAENPWRVLDYEEKSAKWFLSELIRDFANNIIRKESRIQKFPLESIDSQVTEDSFLMAIEQARREEVKAAICQLGETDQIIIRLFYTYNFKTKEIAKTLKLSDANVRKRLQRARAKLKDSLESSKEAVYE